MIRPLTALFGLALLLAACGGGGGGNPLPSGNGGGSATPTPVPTIVPGSGTPLSGPARFGAAGPWGPPGVAQALDFPVQHGYDGTGQTVAIVIDSDVSRSDISTFLNYFQIPATSRTILTKGVDGAVPGTLTDSAGESTLDAETIAGLAPGADIVIYQIPDLSDQSLIDAYNAVMSDGKAYIVNNSFGGCEYAGSQIDPVMKKAAQAGIVFTFASGDNGNVCDNTTNPMTVGANYPASYPYVVGVGGTETNIVQNDPLTNPVVWNDSTACSGGQCAGGGGPSKYYAIPAYQSGLSGVASTTMRNTPDFSMPAEYAAIQLNSVWKAIHGTSWSAPEAAALFAEIYQYCNANGHAIAGVNDPPSIPYYVYAKDPAAFIDVTSGNDQFASTTPFYTAGTGYDDASGLGVPNGAALAAVACPNRTPASGLLARSAMSAALAAPARPAQDTTLDVTPRLQGLVDEGVRAASSPTRIQIVVDSPVNPADAEAHVVAALQGAGFTVTQRFPNHLVVDAVAPSAAINAFFRTQLHNVSQRGYGTRYLPSTQIVVPASIAPYVAGVSLDDVVKMHALLH
jgi:subtilase family serine protease